MRANGRPVALYEYRGSGQPEEPWTGPKCGTYAGWNDHKRCGEKPCQACTRAQADYVREWRYRTGRVRARLVRLTVAELALIRAAREGIAPPNR